MNQLERHEKSLLKPKHKHYRQKFITTTFFLALFFVIGRLGALELDSITVGQAVISSLVAIAYMAVSVITYKIVGKEESYI